MAESESLPVRIAKWPFRQIAGWFENLKAVLTNYEAEDFMPEPFADMWHWLKKQIPQAFGLGTPGEQMSSSVVLAIASIFTSLFTGGVTLFFVSIFVLTFIGGALRLWPAIDALWPLGESET